MGNTRDTGYLQNIVQYDASNNITLPANLTVTGSIVGYATTSYVTTQINNLINGAPGLLDTLDELAAALGDDANFAATLTTSLSGKQASLSGTGFVKISGTTISYDNSVYLTTASASSTYLPLAGGILTGGLTGTSATFSSDMAISGSSGALYSLGQLGFTNTGAGGQYGIYTLGTATPTMYFDHRATGNTGQWVWRSGTGGATTALVLSNSGAATFSSSVGTTALNMNNMASLGSIGGGAIYLPYTAGLLFRSADGSTAKGKITADNSSNLLLNSDNGGYVGIGVTTPQSQLHINGGLTFSESGYNTERLHSITHSHSAGSNPNNFIAINVSNGSNSTLERLRVNGDGNVGIGSLSPVARLTIDGDYANMTGTITYSTNTRGIVINQEGGGGNGTGLWFRHTGLTAGIGSTRISNGDWATDLRFYTHPSVTSNQNTLFERMIINSEGNVGIGTNSPNQKLMIDGLRGQPATTGTTQNGLFRLSTLGSGYGEVLDMGVHVGIDGPSSYSWIQSTNQGSLTVNYNLVLNPNGGSVGIGVSSPTATFHTQVSSSTWVSKIINTNTSTNNAGLLIKAGVNSGNEILLAQKANGSTVFLVDANSCVGIGGITPLSMLHVSESTSGNFTAELRIGGNTTPFGVVTSYTQSAATSGSIYVSPGYSNAGITFKLGAGSGNTNQLVLLGNGNVGVGTSPTVKFEVNGNYKLFGGGTYTSYTPDGLFAASATPNYLGTTGGGGTYAKYNNGGLILGYRDNGSGLYSPAYGFEVKSTDGIPVANRVIEAIYMKDIDKNTTPFVIYNNGDVQNANNSYGSTSDISIKENIIDATSKLDDLLNVRIRNYNLKEDSSKLKQIGVIAQELETVFPGMVKTDTEGLKSVKYSIFVPMLIKAVQELSAKVTELENRNNN
jgi:hypothetical protein